MERWDLLLLAVGAIVAVSTLVRMMRARRDLLMAQFKRQWDEHRQKQAVERARRQNDDAA